MNDQLYREKFDDACELASKTFLKDGHHMQILVLGWEKEGDRTVETIVGFGNYDDEMSDNLDTIIKSAITDIQKETEVSGLPDYFIQIAEGWIGSHKMDDVDLPEKGMPKFKKEFIRPRDDPDRGEGLFVTSAHRDGRSFMWMSEIRREPALHLSEPIVSADTDGESRSRMEDLLWGEEDSSLDSFDKELGNNPPEWQLLSLAYGWIAATVKSPLGDKLPGNVRKSLLKSADLIRDISREKEHYD